MALPANVDTGLTTGRFIVGVIDGPDPDDEPDAIPAQGTIAFTASVPYLPNPTAAPAPVTVLKAPIIGILDSEGYLCVRKPDGTAGARGVRLVATDDPDLSVQLWTWTVTYNFENVNGVTPRIASHSMALPSGSAIDLTTVMKVPSSTGIGIEQAEALAASAQAAASAAATAAQAAQDAAEATDTGVATLVATGPATTAVLDRTYRRGYSVKEYGAIGDGVVDDTAAIQAAADAAFAANGDATLYFPAGTYRTTDTLNILCQIDGRGATLSYQGSGTALIVGTVTPAVTFRKSFWLPRIINQDALNAGAFDGTSIGARLINLNTCQIGFDFIQGFEEGLVCEGHAQGWVHNTTNLGSLWGNHRNLVLRPTTVGAAIGWVNSNLFLNGRLSLNQGWGFLDDPNCSQIVLETPTGSTGGPNSNTWINTSVEGRQADQYRVRVAGRYNQFINCRWENDSGNPLRILYQADAAFNEIRGGYQGMELVEVWAAAAGANTLAPAESAIEARAYTPIAAAIPTATPTTIVWSGFNGYKATHSAGVLTPRPGRWQINATVAAQPAATSGYVDVKIVRNDGTVLAVERYTVHSTTMRTFQVSARENFVSGQTFRVEVQHTTGADLTVNTTTRYSRLQIELLR